MNILKNTLISAALMSIALISNAKLIDINDFSTNLITFDGFNGTSSSPTQIGGELNRDIKIYSSSPSNEIEFSFQGWGLGSNGFATGTFAGLNNTLDSIIIDLAEPVSTIGGVLNHYPNSGRNIIIAAYDEAGSLIESHSLPILSTPNFNPKGVFYGIAIGLNNISRFTVSGGHANIIDDLAVSQVPVPAAAWLFGSALAGLGVVRRKKHVGKEI